MNKKIIRKQNTEIDILIKDFFIDGKTKKENKKKTMKICMRKALLRRKHYLRWINYKYIYIFKRK